jgi:antitoxin (DNA-binding transcriptional repressor) of toxin-antitoxin stability system
VHLGVLLSKSLSIRENLPGVRGESEATGSLVGPASYMYVVHMKRVTASDARRDWFRLLDEVAAGEVVSIDRGGRTILLKRAPRQKDRGAVPDYTRLIRADGAEGADRWSWEWGSEGDLQPREGDDS